MNEIEGYKMEEIIKSYKNMIELHKENSQAVHDLIVEFVTTITRAISTAAHEGQHNISSEFVLERISEMLGRLAKINENSRNAVERM